MTHSECELRCLLQNWQTIRPEWNQLSLDNGLNGKKKENQENRGQEGHHHQPRPPRITSALVNSPGRMHHRSYSPSWLVFYEMWSGPRPLIIYFHISAIQSQRVLSCWAGHLRRERAARDHFGEGYIHCIILENPRIQAKKLMVES